MRSEVTELKKIVVTTKSKVESLTTQVCGVWLGFFSKLCDCAKICNLSSEIVCHILFVWCLLLSHQALAAHRFALTTC